MKTVKIEAPKDSDNELQVTVDGKLLNHSKGDAFYDFDYESSDAWAVYTVLKMLAAAGVITLECDPAVEARYKEQPRPYAGPAGPAGMTGLCQCEGRVAALERCMKTLSESLPS